MILFISIVALIILAQIIYKKLDYSFPKISEVACFSRFALMLFLLFHCNEYFSKGYRYKEFYSEYIAVEKTLKVARINGNIIELAAITKDIIEINKHLSVKKMQRKSFFFKQYVDKRFDDLQFLK